MKHKLIFFYLCIFAQTGLAQNQPTLKPWVEVPGKTNGDQLGKYVLGITPTANLPYRLAVSKNGSTSFFRLQNLADTTAQLTLGGENPLIGDINNDGKQDVVVRKSINGYDTVYVYWGTTTGVDTLSPLKIPGENQFDDLRPALISDINNDGLLDLILSAYQFSALKGKVYIFLNPVTSKTPSATFVGDSLSPLLGVTVAIGDINQDGLKDLLIRGNSQRGSQSDFYDYVNVYWGRVGTNPLNLSFGLQLKSKYVNSAGLACFDVNGDGKPDLVWTARDTSNWVYVNYGGTNFSTSPNLRLINPFPGIANFGYTIANAGDMNGDGYNDIAVGCPDATITSGFVIIYSGGPQIDPIFDAAVAQSQDSYFGWSISSVGDVSGDGLADIVVGAPHYSFTNDQGYWGIFKGDSSIPVTDVRESREVPKDFILEQAYPNPFNPKTTINYRLGSAANVLLELYDELGRHVVTMVKEFKQAGEYHTEFDGSGFPSGNYYYHMTAIPAQGVIFSQTKKFTLIK